RRFGYVSAVDPFGGRHPRLLVPRGSLSALGSTEAVCNHLLSHGDVVTRLRARGAGKVVPLGFDEETEQLAEEAGLELAFPPAAIRARLATLALDDAVGVPPVPYLLGRASSYGVLQALAVRAGLGRDLIVETGGTRVAVSSEQDWLEHAGT